ncbi:MAG: nucleotide sugar dehydrogenase, partial [bacterium]|nr:nucleotide sugar dehydrogenase [bacterium]
SSGFAQNDPKYESLNRDLGSARSFLYRGGPMDEATGNSHPTSPSGLPTSLLELRGTGRGAGQAAGTATGSRVRTDTVAVVGLGYVGLPVAVLARQKGFKILGYDIDVQRVKQVSAGESPVRDRDVVEALRVHSLEATTDAARLCDADVVIVAVPTPVDHHAHPDLEPLRSAIETIARAAKPGVLLSIESTIHPGVCEEVVVPLLKSLGRNPDTGDMLLVHCPERVNPGDEKWTVRNIPRVLGGYTEEATERGVAFYERLLEAPVKRMSSIRAAEAVKIVENAFRDVNIAFANELAQSFDKLGIDVTEVIAGASTKPFAFMAHYPGAGVGGHCIPVDPYYLIAHAQSHGFEHRFLKLAREINKGMPQYTVERLKIALQGVGSRELGVGNGKSSPDTRHPTPSSLYGVRVALLGLAYKRDVGDLRESPALEIEKILRDEGAVITTFDPYVPERSSVATLQEALRQAEAVVVATDHTAFRNLTLGDLAGTPIKVIVDGRNCLDHESFRNAGYAILGIGR